VRAQIAQKGLIALCLAQSPEYVAPAGAAQALYGTNPIGAACCKLA
jgi:LDH2 family malate/lactate/ureidoglycolate dehydrogenase